MKLRQHQQKHICVFAAPAIVVLNTVVAVAAPTLTTIGTFDGDGFSSASSVSADGLVVAGSSSTSSDGIRAFRWTRSGGLQEVGALPGDWYYTAGFGLSGDGRTIVGISNYRPFSWNSSRGLRDLGTPPGNNSGYALASNYDGSVIVGQSDYSVIVGQSTVDLGTRATRWTDSGGIEDLGTLRGGRISAATAISNDGSVVAGVSETDTSDGHAFRWTRATGLVDIGAVAGSGFTQATGMSADGSTIVGFGERGAGTAAFIWTAETGIRELPMLSGASAAYAYAVSADGSVIVGTAGNPGTILPDGTLDTSSVHYRATMWTAALGGVDLNDYLPSIGLDLQGLVLQYATGVSADGSTIVGQALYFGETRGFIVTGVPAPSSGAVVLGLGLVGFRRRRRA